MQLQCTATSCQDDGIECNANCMNMLWGKSAFCILHKVCLFDSSNCSQMELGGTHYPDTEHFVIS